MKPVMGFTSIVTSLSPAKFLIWSFSISAVLSAAVLVLFPAAAGAGIVPSHFGAAAHRFGLGHGLGRFGDHVAGSFAAGGGRGLAGPKSCLLLVNGLLRHVAQKLLEGHHAGSAAENI